MKAIKILFDIAITITLAVMIYGILYFYAPSAQAQEVNRLEVFTYTLTGVFKGEKEHTIQIKDIPSETECYRVINENALRGICTRALHSIEQIGE